MTQISADHWRRIQAAFDVVLDAPPEQRASLLAEIAADDQELCREVEQLLHHASREGGLLDSPALEFAGGLLASLDPEPQRREGTRIGPWRVVRQIGQGGMGIVFLVERDDAHYRQVAALKLAGRELDSDRTLRRFIDERQILARMEHPGIARLLDGGVTEDGLPYLVMEYVEGEPIDQYCDRNRLSLEARLELFRHVCHAVAWAHRALVVHRDLKPSNILVTAAGDVKLLDFGIAKLLDGSAPVLTMTGARPMTPRYASPEQIRGDPVSTSSDVYSLGVLLYLLLTGHHPYGAAARSQHEIERAILEHDPTLPSAVVSRPPDVDSAVATDPAAIAGLRGTTAQALRRALRGDLDVIVLRALDKQPERRYHSSDQLADDIQRHLAGHPVRARKDSFAYRARKFARRNRGWVAAAGVATLALLGAATISVRQARLSAAAALVAERERDRAQMEEARSQAVAKFLVDLFAAARPTDQRQDTVTARTLLDRGAERIERELNDQPEVRASIASAIGEAYFVLGEFESSTRMAERALVERRRLYGEEHPDIAVSLRKLGWVLFERQLLDSAERVLRVAVPMSRRVHGERHPETAEALSDLAVVMQARGNRAESEQLHLAALEAQRGVAGQELPLASTLNNLAWLAENRGDLDSAMALFREALELKRRFGADVQSLSNGLMALATVGSRAGQEAQADSAAREALRLRRAALGEDHVDVGHALVALGSVALRRGATMEADSLFRAAIVIFERTLGESHMVTARAWNDLAGAVRRQGRFREAAALYAQSLKVFEQQLGSEHLFTLIIRGNYGSALPLAGEERRGEAILRATLAGLERTVGVEHFSVPGVALPLADVLRRRGSAVEAEQLARRSLATRRAQLPEGHPQIAAAESILGAALSALGRYAEADSLLRRSVEVMERRFGEGETDTRLARGRLEEHIARQR